MHWRPTPTPTTSWSASRKQYPWGRGRPGHSWIQKPRPAGFNPWPRYCHMDRYSAAHLVWVLLLRAPGSRGKELQYSRCTSWCEWLRLIPSETITESFSIQLLHFLEWVNTVKSVWDNTENLHYKGNLVNLRPSWKSETILSLGVNLDNLRQSWISVTIWKRMNIGDNMKKS